MHSGDRYHHLFDFITDALDITVARTEVFPVPPIAQVEAGGFGLGRCLLLVLPLAASWGMM
jgi:hypothetical protein